MPSSKPTDGQRLFETELPLIEQQIRWLCRRKRLSHQDADDFASYARERLWRDNYAVLSKYRGEAPFKAFLISTLGRMLQDFRVQQWGRWRPSAIAERLGWIAVELERLTERDHLSFSEACAILLRQDPHAATEESLEEIWLQLPRRVRAREVDEASMPFGVAGGERADDRLEEQEASREAAAFQEALSSILDGLDAEERSILKLHYWKTMSIANVARALQIEQKPLYRRMDRLKMRLRQDLAEAGINAERFSSWLGREGFELRVAIDDESEKS